MAVIVVLVSACRSVSSKAMDGRIELYIITQASAILVVIPIALVKPKGTTLYLYMLKHVRKVVK